MDVPDFAAMFAEIAATREPELVLLKGHLYVERALAWVAAVRLHSPDEKFNLKYPVLAQLAIRTESDRKRVLALNELRNALAHEFGALDTPRFANLIGKCDLPWPSGALERAITLQLIVQDVYYRTINALVLELRIDSEPGLRRRLRQGDVEGVRTERTQQRGSSEALSAANRKRRLGQAGRCVQARLAKTADVRLTI